jgi:L-serine dehydratase
MTDMTGPPFVGSSDGNQAPRVMDRRFRSLRDLFRMGFGPSSSHSMGPGRAAELFRDRTPGAARYRITLYGSLAATGLAHMTDDALRQALAPAQVEIERDEETEQKHPNTLVFEALDGSGTRFDIWRVYSVGGASLEDDDGPVNDEPDIRYAVGTIADALEWCQREGKPFWALPAECEPDAWEWLGVVWNAMREAVARGLESEECVLPGGLNLPRKAESAHVRAHNLSGVTKDLSLISSYALAVAEENAAGKRVVTAPTCGSAGVLPAILYYFNETQSVSERQILCALATAGLFGTSVKANASVSGAEVGCQGEVGTACAMAAAAAAQLLGGTPAQVEYAAEMGLEHHLGLTCDPVEGLVQIPCIERNAVAATRALVCASYALLSDGRHVISFDEVVEVMYRTGRDLQAAYRETGRGGLAEIWSRRAQRLRGG